MRGLAELEVGMDSESRDLTGAPNEEIEDTAEAPTAHGAKIIDMSMV